MAKVMMVKLIEKFEDEKKFIANEIVSILGDFISAKRFTAL